MTNMLCNGELIKECAVVVAVWFMAVMMTILKREKQDARCISDDASRLNAGCGTENNLVHGP